MAERRMFSKSIIDSDNFLEMPLSSQALYFHLSMRADDEGFVNNPKKIQQMLGASDDDMKVLIVKKFVIRFNSGIIVIRHWKLHNYIRKDRLQATKYQEERQMLEVKENEEYTSKLIAVSQMSDKCQSNVSQLPDKCQHRLGKVRLGKVSITPLPPLLDTEKFKEAWEEFRQHRKEIKSKLTPRAEQMLIKKLADMATSSDEAVAIVEQSIANGWRGLFPLHNTSYNSKKIKTEEVDLLGNPFEDILPSDKSA